ncbi:MAG: hypothetical protein BMS9Abin34_375 [Patescibacteria group bacterium]|nr:MAG: hypothetical protein BMS9Abin34_375 [Patescibacteria group bacterium]
MRRKRRILTAVLLLILIVAGIWFFTLREQSDEIYPQPPEAVRENEIYPEVWSQKSPKGESYEFKVNCTGSYSQLEACFLWNLSAVKVTAPNGAKYNLEKDFNINEYSGETTRRWVLYGPLGEGLPETGSYAFEYFKDGEAVFTQAVSYTQSSISYPTGVTWKRNGRNLEVRWTPPRGADNSMWYKVLVWNTGETPDLFISDIFKWNADSAVMKNVPLIDGGKYSLNVALYYPNGYAYSKYIIFSW